MEPQIQTFVPRILAGFSFFGDPFHAHAGWTGENEIGRLWQRLLSFLALGTYPAADLAVTYEVHLQNHETARTGEFEIFVGFEVSDPRAIPVELCLKVLPGGEYAVFTLRGEQVHSDEPIFDAWCAASGRKAAYPFFVERYDARFKGVDRLAESEVDFWLPVAPRDDHDPA